MNIIKPTSLLCALFWTSFSYAWDGHILLTYMALKNMPEMRQLKPVGTETLSSFLEKEQVGIGILLNEIETWSRIHIPYYPPLPQSLAFQTQNKTQDRNL